MPYQLRWLSDQSSHKAAVKSRRIGFSEVVSFECACRAAGVDIVNARNIKPINQNIISASHAQAKELLGRCLRHIEALGFATPEGSIIEGKSATMVTLKNKAKLIAFSSNPRTIRGYEGDVTLDEFGNTANQDKVWAAAAPLAKATLGAPLGYKIRVIGTPEGDGNRFYRICKGELSKRWSVHEVNVIQAVADGFPLMTQNEAGEMVPGTIDDLREEIGDEDTFNQEFMCAFLSANMRYIPEQLWDACTYHLEDLPTPQLAGTTTFFGGMDVGRSRDLSAIVRLERIVETLWHHDTEVERGMNWDAQEAWVDRMITRCSRFAVDATGIGSQFAERMGNRWAGKVEPVDFTNANKEELATGLKLALERKRLRPRADDFELRRDVLLLRREVTKMGNIRFDAQRTKQGHADRAWALALAVYAAGGAASKVAVPSVTLPRNDNTVQPAPVKRGGWR